jgi:hypothetical protein
MQTSGGVPVRAGSATNAGDVTGNGVPTVWLRPRTATAERRIATTARMRPLPRASLVRRLGAAVEAREPRAGRRGAPTGVQDGEDDDRLPPARRAGAGQLPPLSVGATPPSDATPVRPENNKPAGGNRH